MKKQFLALLLALLLLFAACATPEPETGEKTITVTVTYLGEEEVLTVETDAEMLGEALLEKNLIQGSESEYGLFVDTVNGHRADANENQYWVFTKSGEWVTTGVDTTPIADGDSFEFFLYE